MCIINRADSKCRQAFGIKLVFCVFVAIQLSREEHLWQNELKDLIWLELQAWHADRTPTEQDKYLCEAREGVQQLLLDIINYR